MNSAHPSSLRRYSRRNSARGVDLNSPPQPLMPAPTTEGGDASTPIDVEADATPIAVEPAATSVVVEAAVTPTTVEAATMPIDVEAIADNDLQLTSSWGGFTQARNQPLSRNQPVVVVVDEEQVPSEQSAYPPYFAHAPLSSSSPYRRRRPRKTLPWYPQKRTVVNCESNSTSEDNKASTEEPKQVVPKEPNFGCPICMSSLINPCSTICGHIFCESCLNAAVQVQKKCPTCRTKLSNKGFHRVFLPNTISD